MIVNTPAANAFLFNAFKMLFANAYLDAPEQLFPKFCTTVASGTLQETYSWPHSIPALRKWVGDKQFHSIATSGYTLVNQPYEDSVEIDKFQVEDDQFGVFAPVMKDLARAAKQWPDVQIASMLAVAQSTTCFDNQNFFDAAHPVSKFGVTSGTYRNYYSTGKALTYDNFADVYQQMLAFKRDDGTPMGIRPTHLLVPPGLRQVAKQILHAEFVGVQTFAGATQVGTNSNVLINDVELVIDEFLTESTAWYLLDCSRGVKPFIFQQRQAPTMIPRVAPTDTNVFDKHLLQYSIEARGAFGFTLPFLAFKCIA